MPLNRQVNEEEPTKEFLKYIEFLCNFSMILSNCQNEKDFFGKTLSII